MKIDASQVAEVATAVSSLEKTLIKKSQTGLPVKNQYKARKMKKVANQGMSVPLFFCQLLSMIKHIILQTIHS